jgi:hypothetical protein
LGLKRKRTVSKLTGEAAERAAVVEAVVGAVVEAAEVLGLMSMDIDPGLGRLHSLSAIS